MNQMFLTCRHHATRAESFLIAARSDNEPYAVTNWVKFGEQLQKFLTAHAGCGRSFDHFTVSYSETKDNDVPKDAPVAEAVHAALRVVK